MAAAARSPVRSSSTGGPGAYRPPRRVAAVRGTSVSGRERGHVEEVGEVVGVRIAVGHRRQVELPLDEREHGRMVVDDARDIVRLRVGADDDRRNAEPVAMETVEGPVALDQERRDVVGRKRDRRRDVVVVAAVLVVGDDQDRLAPPRRGADRLDDLTEEGLADDDVLGFSCDSVSKFGSIRLNAGNVPAGGVREELTERLDVRLLVLEINGREERLGRPGERARRVDVLEPADPSVLQGREDRAVRRGQEQRDVLAGRLQRGVIGHPHRRAGDQKASVRVGLTEHAAEPAVADREGAREVVGERKVVPGPVAPSRRRPTRM